MLPIKWHDVHWGTVPEWIGVVALLVIAVAVWTLARNSRPVRDSSDRYH
jgi:hypothetical protein